MAVHDGLGAQLPEVLDEVVDERVVVVDHEARDGTPAFVRRTLACRAAVVRASGSRYTPPPPKKAPPSKLWVPVSDVRAAGHGLLVVVTNYLGLLPGRQQNRYLLLGIVLIASGFMFPTGYR